MQSLPLFHRLKDQPVLVLGEGEAAEAKARLVCEAGGRVVTEVEPGTRLAFLALAEGAEDAAAELRARGLLVNVVDRPELCDFTVPAIVDRTPVIVAAGTGGASASLAKALKERLEMLLPGSLGPLALAIRQSRASVAGVHADVPARRDFWARMLAPGAPLDPLAPQPDPAATIVDALAETPASASSIAEISIGPDGADALTLRELRLMAQADLVLHAPGTPPDVLALIRRDAARRVGTELPDGLEGRILVIRLAD